MPIIAKLTPGSRRTQVRRKFGMSAKPFFGGMMRSAGPV